MSTSFMMKEPIITIIFFAHCYRVPEKNKRDLKIKLADHFVEEQD